MESAMVPSFSFLRPYAIPRHTGHGKWHGTPTKPNTLPQLAAYPVWSQHIQGDFHTKGVFSQMLQNCFSEKWKNFSSLGNVSIGKRGKPI